ncbi:MAG: bifunctional diaminohydroxyphosphoribosylaminopyrimidine deaminase/5-amino-6-(5-phosphoribosylamino)uracil reductase RibD [Candidatus Methanofastidiosa archaeon]|nr:bifunctional diaminohydroxyphosphoribosylaminopyrimidine deaminase/5-amino-6-(5-phosphoribosylamino)uracil reductase RibD [Candidatus Methanofastidiosa archaeon]
MARALDLARRGYTPPNPMVGAVIVKDGEIIGEGFHEAAGRPHAERMALMGIDAKGSTLYVNLEPCSHHGKTPPCTDAIISAGISRVVCAMEDPNPLVSGIEILRDAGIEVQVGVLEKEARRLNEAFIKYMVTGTPFVLLKTAMSMDGKISTSSGDSKWITSDPSRMYSRDLRGRFDSIMVGVNTVIKDDPSLKAGTGKDPLRIILDSKLRSPIVSKVFDDDNVLVVVTEQCGPERMARFKEEGVEIVTIGKDKVEILPLMDYLGKRGITSVFIEGGGEVNGSAIDAGVVDKFLFFIAPKIIGGRNAPGPIGGKGVDGMFDAISLKDVRISNIGDDIVIEAYPAHGASR